MSLVIKRLKWCCTAGQGNLDLIGSIDMPPQWDFQGHAECRRHEPVIHLIDNEPESCGQYIVCMPIYTYGCLYCFRLTSKNILNNLQIIWQWFSVSKWENGSSPKILWIYACSKAYFYEIWLWWGNLKNMSFFVTSEIIQQHTQCSAGTFLAGGSTHILWKWACPVQRHRHVTVTSRQVGG